MSDCAFHVADMCSSRSNELFWAPTFVSDLVRQEHLMIKAVAVKSVCDVELMENLKLQLATLSL